jgi:hypothetical protein
MKLAIVYSALHTGTKFTYNTLTNCSTGNTIYKKDCWFGNKDYVSNLETLVGEEGPTRYKINKILEEQERLDNVDCLIMQVHQRRHGNLYSSLLKNKSEIPIVVPIRDPLLSINTRLWRETGTMSKLLSDTEETRIARTKDQLDSIIRLIQLDNVFFFPIDIVRTEGERLAIVNKMLSYCGLTLNDKAKQIAKDWTPINPTVGGNFAQQKLYTIEEKEYVELKEAILNKDLDTVEKFISIEFKLLKQMLSPYKDRYTQLGYKDLLWYSKQ